MDKISIEEYRADYQQEVVELILQIQQQEYGIQITKEDQPDLFEIESFYQKGNGNFFVAIRNNEVIGTISLLDIENDQVALRKMFVKKEYRGTLYKTASFLLTRAMDYASEKGINQIYLGTTPEFLAAHRFYEKNGFIQIYQEKLPSKFPLVKVDRLFYQYTF
ncbi:GNAT family N-acetyltransferase [Rummeliibacillus sp. NPDC094406]|uniref:GNAT family N-acetyltransferase n=1 Tax=Rummeliibacillus sp. NPDC094406 TaxID=3364511 RepID=UPI0037F99E69